MKKIMILLFYMMVLNILSNYVTYNIHITTRIFSDIKIGTKMIACLSLNNEVVVLYAR